LINNMNSPKKRKRTSKYDPKLRIAIAQEYLNTDMGYGSLSKKYGIAASTIKDFITWYNQKYTTGIEVPVGDALEVTNSGGQTDSDLKVIALQLLIENASKELGVDLVKKFGTKQPKK
jgi:transposase-like protein